MARIVWACSECGSQNIAVDAAARWNAEQGEWVVTEVWTEAGHVSCYGCHDEKAEAVEREETEEEAEERILREDEEREAALERAADPGPG